MNVGIVTLGCNKNQVDSEMILGLFKELGYSIVNNPDDADVILCDEDKGVYRSNKIIVNNPRKITDEMVIEFYKINTLPSKVIYQCLVTLLYKNRINIAKYIINDYITIDNIKDAIEEFENYVTNENFEYSKLSSDEREIYDLLKSIEAK